MLIPKNYYLVLTFRNTIENNLFQDTCKEAEFYCKDLRIKPFSDPFANVCN